MSKKNTGAPRKHLRKIFMLIILAMMIPLTLFASIAYRNEHRALTNNEYEANKKILAQLKYNIDYMDGMIANSAMSMYANQTIRSIMYASDADFAEIISVMNNLKYSIVNTNPFIHSVYVYNNQTKDFYSTEGGLFFEDNNLERLLQSGADIPVLKAVPRAIDYPTIGDLKRKENVVTYFMFDFKDNEGRFTGGLIVNASTKWILDNIKAINNTAASKQDIILLLDRDGEVIGDQAEEGTAGGLVKQSYHRHAASIGADAGAEPNYFVDVLDSRKYLLTYIKVDNMDWTIVKAQSYDEVFANIKTLRNTFFTITALFLIAIAAGSIAISRKIYKPIGTLMQRVGSFGIHAQEPSAKDEFVFLNEVYQSSLEQINQYKLEKHSSQDIIKAYFLRRLLVDSRSIRKEEFEQLANDARLNIRPDKPLVLILMKIRKRSEFEHAHSARDRGLYKFGMMNIASEVIGQTHPNETFEIHQDYMVMLLNTEKAEDANGSVLTELWLQARNYIQNYCQIGITVTIAEPVMDFRQLSETHRAALNDSLYGVVFDKEPVIRRGLIQANQKNTQICYPDDLGKKLSGSLKSGALAPALETLDHIFQAIGKLNYNNIMLSIMQLINALQETVDEINRSKVEPLPVNFNLLSQKLLAMESLADMRSEIAQLCENMISTSSHAEEEKQNLLVEAVKEMVQIDYMKSDLCLAMIAERLNLSAKHVAKIFNGHMNMSVGDYINEIRMEKAVQWLETSNVKIKDILPKIGYENESYFYRLFKSKYGITPKEYAVNAALKQIQPNKS